jgi:hypothetical protein
MKKAILLVALCLGTLASAQQLSKEMTVALKNDDANAVLNLVDQDEVNTCFTAGTKDFTLVQLAVTMDSADVLESLINEYDLDLDETCGSMTALMYAAQADNPSMVRILVDAGADTAIKIDGKDAAALATGNNAARIKELLK